MTIEKIIEIEMDHMTSDQIDLIKEGYDKNFTDEEVYLYAKRDYSIEKMQSLIKIIQFNKEHESQIDINVLLDNSKENSTIEENFQDICNGLMTITAHNEKYPTNQIKINYNEYNPDLVELAEYNLSNSDNILNLQKFLLNKEMITMIPEQKDLVNSGYAKGFTDEEVLVFAKQKYNVKQMEALLSAILWNKEQPNLTIDISLLENEKYSGDKINIFKDLLIAKAFYDQKYPDTNRKMELDWITNDRYIWNFAMEDFTKDMLEIISGSVLWNYMNPEFNIDITILESRNYNIKYMEVLQECLIYNATRDKSKDPINIAALINRPFAKDMYTFTSDKWEVLKYAICWNLENPDKAIDISKIVNEKYNAKKMLKLTTKLISEQQKTLDELIASKTETEKEPILKPMRNINEQSR